MTLVVNFVAGPGSGKSTVAAATFAELKMRGASCELVTEYAKDCVWGDTTATLDDQVYVMAKQHHRLWRLRDKVDVIVTDSPLFLLTYYGMRESTAYAALALELFESFDNMTWYLKRPRTYVTEGRLQNENDARQIDAFLLAALIDRRVSFTEVNADKLAASRVADAVIALLRGNGVT